MYENLIKKLAICLMSFIVFSIPLGGNAFSEDTESTYLESLIEEALENNPGIRVAEKRWKAAKYKSGYVKGLPDPMISYTYFGENVETRVGPQEHKYGASQKIPFPGKLPVLYCWMKEKELTKTNNERSTR